MRRTILLLACLGGLAAADPTASDIAAELIVVRAREFAQHGEGGVGHQLEELAAGVRAGRISLAEAQQVLAVAQSLPGVRPPPPPRAPGLSVEQAGAALDGRLQPPPPAAPMPPPTAMPTPPPPVGPASVATPAAVPPPAGPEPVVIGKLLAVQPGADGKPALLALATNPKVAVKEGQRLAVRRDHATLALARVTKVGPDLTIALLIPGTWSDDKVEIHADDEIALVDQ